jgi:hypothetical protein
MSFLSRTENWRTVELVKKFPASDECHAEAQLRFLYSGAEDASLRLSMTLGMSFFARPGEK